VANEILYAIFRISLYVGDEILNFVVRNTPPERLGADLRENSMRRVDFSTHPMYMYVLVCMDDAVVCERFFGNLLAMKPLSVASAVI